MRNRIHKILLGYAALLMLVSACKPELEAPDVNANGLDFTHYVAVGNSITAGYADGALYYEGQQNSLAKLIAQQFQLAQSFDFRQPLIPQGSIGIGASLNAKYALYNAADCKGVYSLTPKPVAGIGDYLLFNFTDPTKLIYSTQGPFNNMGVPGVKSTTTLVHGYGNYTLGTGNYNPFYSRMASAPLTSSILDDAMAQTPSFFTLFLGNNDVLLYALSGGKKDAITPSAGSAGFGFDNSMQAIVTTLTSGGAEGVIATVPSITSIPHFTTIPWNGLVLDQPTIDFIVQKYLNAGVPAGSIPPFHVGVNAFVMADASQTYGFRQMVAGEYVLLSTPGDSIKCKGWGSAKALPDSCVLNATEVLAINNAVTAYNITIRNLATTHNLPLVDVNAFLQQAETGITYNGVTVNTKFASGGAFS